MFEITRYEGRQKLRGAYLLTIGFVLISALYIGLFPSVEQSGVDFEAYMQSLPEGFQESFGVGSLSTIEGFLAIELYQFIWLLLFGIYAAYSAGGLIAADLEAGRLDLLLATPVSRTQVAVEKFASLLVPILVPNLLLPFAIVMGVQLIGESVPIADLFVVHLFSIPYLLTCAAIGFLLSVLVDRATVAQRGSIVTIFMLFLVEAIAQSADADWLGILSPTRYYNPGDILVDGTYDVVGALLLMTATAALLLVSVASFQRRDIT